MKTAPFLFILVLLISCKKQQSEKKYTIEGQVLESSSNPVPVPDYTIVFSQKANIGLIGGVSGLYNPIKTGADGQFKFQYSPDKSYGFSLGGTNPNPIIIYGVDTLKYKGVGSTWYSVPPLTDINLNTIYLYKKITSLVRKVQFNNPLNSGESLDLISPDSSGSNRTTITGPVSAGTTLTVDTIRNCKLSSFNLQTREFHFTLTLTKPSYLSFIPVVIPPGDELYREVLITY